MGKGIAPESQKAIDKLCSLPKFGFFALECLEIASPKPSGALGLLKIGQKSGPSHSL
jgi:hypothetical protein